MIFMLRKNGNKRTLISHNPPSLVDCLTWAETNLVDFLEARYSGPLMKAYLTR